MRQCLCTVQPCGEMCGSSYHVCVLRLSSWRRMLLYPVCIYFPTLGGEGTFVRVGVKTEFSASWLPPRMMGHREDPPSQRGRLLQQGKRKELPMWLWDWLDGGQARNEPKLTKVTKIVYIEVEKTVWAACCCLKMSGQTLHDGQDRPIARSCPP